MKKEKYSPSKISEFFMEKSLNYSEDVLKNGFSVTLDEETPFVIYCNEKKYNGKGFLFKCCKGCKYNLSTKKIK